MSDNTNVKAQLEQAKKDVDDAYRAMKAKEDELALLVKEKKEKLENQNELAWTKLQELQKKQKNMKRSFLWKLFNKSQVPQYEKDMKDLDEQISTARDTWCNLYGQIGEMIKSKNPLNDPELPRLTEKWADLCKKLNNLEVQEIEKLNSLIVFADIENARVFGSRNCAVSVSSKVDGVSRGYVSQPFSVIPLTNGIHSVSFEVASNSHGLGYDTKDCQFSIQNNCRYFIVNNINLYSAASVTTISVTKCDDLNHFLSSSRMSLSDFKSYLQSL